MMAQVNNAATMIRSFVDPSSVDPEKAEAAEEAIAASPISLE